MDLKKFFDQLGAKDKGRKAGSPRFLTWRDDPNQTLSDWTIVVTGVDKLVPDDEHEKALEQIEEAIMSSVPLDNDSNAVVAMNNNHKSRKIGKDKTNTSRSTYFVHRNALLFGGSEYFRRLFTTSMNLKEKQTSTSTFEFLPEACDCFPFMLDYFYRTMTGVQDNSFRFPLEKVAGMRFLSSYFDIPPLQRLSLVILSESLTPDNAVALLKMASLFDDEQLVDYVAEKCASWLHDIEEEEFFVMPHDLFRRVVVSSSFNETKYGSTLCFGYLTANREDLNPEYFRFLTSCLHLSELSPAAALGFMALLRSGIQHQNLVGTRCGGCRLTIEDCLVKRTVESVTAAPPLTQESSEKHRADNTLDDYFRGLCKEYPVPAFKSLLNVYRRQQRIIGEYSKFLEHTTNTILPQVVEVTGAGLSQLNGFYFKHDLNDGLRFTKVVGDHDTNNSNNNKQPVILCCTAVTSNDGYEKKVWVISKSDYEVERNWYYKATVVSSKTDCIEEETLDELKWEVSSLGESPAPKKVIVSEFKDVMKI